MKRTRLRLLASAVALLLPACGGDGGPIEVAPRDIPFSLARTQAPSPEPTTERSLTVYFVRGNRLVPATRQVPAKDSDVDAAMQALLDGPTTGERGTGITSEIPADTSLLQVQVLDFVAEVDLSSEFQGPAPPEGIVLRVAQVVWTLVNLPQITAVRFLIDGELIGVVTDHGNAIQRPVTAPDYASVAPPG